MLLCENNAKRVILRDLQSHLLFFTRWWWRRRTQPIGNIASQSDSVTATAATTATAAACISSLVR